MKSATAKFRRWQGVPRGSNLNDRPSVYLGWCTVLEYGSRAEHLRALESAVRYGATPPAATLAWLASVDDKLHQRIVRAGLCEPRPDARPRPVTLAAYIAEYIGR